MNAVAEGVRTRPRVLVVDDDPDTRLLLRAVLEPAGYDVYGRADGVAALDTALAVLPSVVLLDWVLPDCSGLEVCSAMRSRELLDATGIVMITARRHAGDPATSHGAGADRFLAKPLVPSVVSQCVRALTYPRPD